MFKKQWLWWDALLYILSKYIFVTKKKYAAGFTLSGKCCVPEAKTCSPCPPLLTPEHDTVEYSFCGLEFTKYIRLLSYHNCEISLRDSITRKCVSYSYKSTLRIFGYAINIRCQQLFFTDYKLAIRDSFLVSKCFISGHCPFCRSAGYLARNTEAAEEED